MSFIARRGISTLIPPKIASPSAIGASKDAARMERVSDFYARLPRGAAPEVKSSGLVAKYGARYFGKNSSSAPLIHLLVGLALMGYSIQYVTHLHIFNQPVLNFRTITDVVVYPHLSRVSSNNYFSDKVSTGRLGGVSSSHSSNIVMAEQRSNNVVNQTRSDGDLSPSDVPASTTVNLSAGGERGEVRNSTNTNNSTPQPFESTPQKPATTISYSESAEVNSARSNSHDTDSNISPSVLVDASGGSDTDASRPDLRTSTDPAQHTRTSSVKRPASFKPVSFPKFSVAKPPGSSSALKTTLEKAPFSSSTASSASTPSTSRPRLVAKSGVLSSSTPRALGAGTANKTDGNLVWNKNRPAQPPPTKHLTDEELKQQYGIHMTSRLEAETNDKESKWADIDDDEDDWAPESLEWNDGTKITLTHTESLSQTVPQAPQITNDLKGRPNDLKQAPETTPAARGAPKLLLSKPSTTLGSNTTILKLGGNTEKLTKSLNDPTRHFTEKATISSKGVSPPTVKSPWAALPPVEKVSPIMINPLQHQLPSHALPGEPSNLETGPPTLSPTTKEIAADDFSRTWRDNNHPAAPRELYNSQSGRYEPVPDNRRGPPKYDRAVKNDPSFRPASLLQRPNLNDHPGPAEPSAAFQTHRSGADGSSWSRARASSNVSSGSGGFVRRMSMSKHDGPFKGRDAPRGMSPSSAPHDRPVSPGSHRRPNGPMGPRAMSPQQPSQYYNQMPFANHYTPPSTHAGLASQATDGAPHQVQPIVEDPIAMQQRIMREKREMARQRRMEEEAKEEAAKQERIRLKLQAMGVHPDDMSTSKDAADKAKRPSVSSHSVASPPKPPVLEPSGGPKQYGMMRVHPPELVKKLVTTNEKVADKSHPVGNNNRQPPTPRNTRPEEPAPMMNGSKPETQPAQSLHPVRDGIPEDKSAQWKYAVAGSPSTYTSWPNAKVNATALGALWGPPTNDKALGNGTFDRNLTSFPPQDLSSHGATLGLPEPPHVLPSPSQDAVDASEISARPLPPPASKGIPEGSQVPSSLPSPDKRHGRLADGTRSAGHPRPIAPPSNPQGQRWSQDRQGYRSQETSAWNNFHAVAQKTEAEENEKFQQELRAVRDEETRTGISPSLQVNFNETWRQVDAGELGTTRNIVGVKKASDEPSQTSVFHDLEAVAGLPFGEKNKAVSTPSVRGSRFFPQAAEPKKSSQENASARSQSPPPPEEVSSHPVFTGDSQRPLVHLPNPKPRVRLPPGAVSPTQSSPPQAPATFASMVAAPPPARPVSQPIVSTATWQDRFNGLFGKKTTRPVEKKKGSPAVTSATKVPLEVLPSTTSASVSLPRYDEIPLPLDAGKITSKEVEDEEAIFEDREAGSLPVVKVPYMAPRAAWQPALPPMQSRFRTKYQRPVLTQSIEVYALQLDRDGNGDLFITIKPPGLDKKKVMLPKKVTPTSSPRHRSNPKHRKNTKSRDNSGQYQASHQSGKKIAPSTAVSTTSHSTPTRSPKSHQPIAK
ncbi:hypothetical protein FQN57_003392 [Myotisia sp. PD_48]|nr:hypothetical protein FQN57_003392 [Myotisia sp. PD_48]